MTTNRIGSTNSLSGLKIFCKENFDFNQNLIFTSRPHIVQVVSILDVPIKLGSISFQSNDVNGAQKSEFLF
jgi:hypothetical protein